MPRTSSNLTLLYRPLDARTLSDTAFDALLPELARTRSAQYWTPLLVARRAADMLRAHRARRVLDVGCGPGKFCLAAAATQPSIDFLGVERRPHLVEAASELAWQLGLKNASFVCGDAFERSWSGFDAFYFFNPFTENLCPEAGKFDQSVELSGIRFLGELRRMSVALQGLRPGAVFITYHGLGTPIPASYELVESEPAGTDVLRLWRKGHGPDQDWCHMENDDGVSRVTKEELRTMETSLRMRFNF